MGKCSAFRSRCNIIIEPNSSDCIQAEVWGEAGQGDAECIPPRTCRSAHCAYQSLLRAYLYGAMVLFFFPPSIALYKHRNITTLFQGWKLAERSKSSMTTRLQKGSSCCSHHCDQDRRCAGLAFALALSV